MTGTDKARCGGLRLTARTALAMVSLLAVLGAVPERPNEKPSPAKGRQLVEALELATLEKKESNARKYVQRARALVDEGADVNARGQQGRTALHWIAIGAARFDGKETHRLYRELAEVLIDAGIDVNAEDDYGNTTLDWEEANPRDALRYVLEQAGAQWGISHKEGERLADYIRNLRELTAKKKFAAVEEALKADVPEETRIWVRLTKPLHSKNSRCGEKLEGVVIAPAVSGGRVVLSPGTPVWVASATHDIGIGVGRKGTQWYHLIDLDIDKERQKIADDLLFTGVATGYTLVDRPDAPRQATNATGDELRTDGRMMVLHLTEDNNSRWGGSVLAPEPVEKTALSPS